MKIFQIGFNKCGTLAISRFFELNGFSCVHWDEGRLARQMKRNLDEGRYILSGYDNYDVFTDMEFVGKDEIIEGFKYFPLILERVDDPLFILNTRNKQNWIASRIDHKNYIDHRNYLERYRIIYRLDDEAAVIERWLEDWDSHHAAVQELIPQDRLLVYDIESDSPTRLCQFAGLAESCAQHYVVRNYTDGGLSKFISKWTPQPVKGMVPNSAKKAIKLRLRKRRRRLERPLP